MDKLLTREEAIRRHRELWYKIAEMQEASDKPIDKGQALLELGCLKFPINYCWCCEYVLQFPNAGCKVCPIRWPVKTIPKNPMDCSAICLESIYSDWCSCMQSNHASEGAIYARMIAELPEAEFEDETDDDLNDVFP